MNRYSLLHATRSTPDRALSTRAVWLDRAKHPKRVQHIFGVQDDDHESIKAFTNAKAKFVQTPKPPEWASSSVANWNAAARLSTGDWSLIIADDLIPARGWDDALDQDTAQIDQTRAWAIQVPDGIADDELLRHPIVNRALYHRRGRFIFDPAFYGVYCDNDLTLWCRKHANVSRAESMRVKHLHPINGSRLNDPITALQNSDAAYQYGSKMLLRKWPDAKE
jgi:hypothetical protein